MKRAGMIIRVAFFALLYLVGCLVFIAGTILHELGSLLIRIANLLSSYAASQRPMDIKPVTRAPSE
jgi:hypothetical protein